MEKRDLKKKDAVTGEYVQCKECGRIGNWMDAGDDEGGYYCKCGAWRETLAEPLFSFTDNDYLVEVKQ